MSDFSPEIFGSNNHSVFEIAYQEVSEEIRILLGRILGESFGIKDIISIEQVKERENASNNFRISYLDGSVTRKILLRKNIRVDTEEKLELIEEALGYLKENAVPVPELIRPLSGGVHAWKDGSFFQAFKYIEGNHFSGTEDELRSMARSTAHLHDTLSRFPWAESLQSSNHFLPPWDMEGLVGVLDAAENRNITPIDRLLVEGKSFLVEVARRTREEFSGVVDARAQPIHGDLHPHNTLFFNGELTAFLDFEMLQLSELLRDIGFVAHRFSRQFAVHGDTETKGAQRGYRIFLEEYQAVSALRDGEAELIPIFIKDELLRRIVKDSSLYYSLNDDRYVSVDELNKKFSLLAEADIL